MNKKFYKIYALIIGLLFFVNYMQAVPFNLLIYADFAISMVGFAGYIAFSYDYKIIGSWFWKIWFFIMIGWDIYINIFSPVADISSRASINNLIITYMILLPEYYGVFKYGFKSSELWK